MFALRNKITSTVLSLILLVSIFLSSAGLSSFAIKHHAQNSEQGPSDVADDKTSEKEDCKDLKEKFTNHNSDKILFPKLPTDLAQLDADRLIQKFFLSVPVSPPNS